jgi:hypothetical protein
MKQVYNFFDRSLRIKNLIKWLSTSLASRRGLPVLSAIVLTVISLIVHIIAVISGNQIVSLCGFSLLHIAILIGFLGVLLAEPLGRG